MSAKDSCRSERRVGALVGGRGGMAGLLLVIALGMVAPLAIPRGTTVSAPDCEHLVEDAGSRDVFFCRGALVEAVPMFEVPLGESFTFSSPEVRYLAAAAKAAYEAVEAETGKPLSRHAPDPGALRVLATPFFAPPFVGDEAERLVALVEELGDGCPRKVSRTGDVVAGARSTEKTEWRDIEDSCPAGFGDLAEWGIGSVAISREWAAQRPGPARLVHASIRLALADDRPDQNMEAVRNAMASDQWLAPLGAHVRIEGWKGSFRVERDGVERGLLVTISVAKTGPMNTIVFGPEWEVRLRPFGADPGKIRETYRFETDVSRYNGR